MVVSIQFVGRLSHKVPKRNVCLTRCPGVNDRVRVEVQYLLLQLIMMGVQLKTGPTGGESSHEDVDASVVRLVFIEVEVIYLYYFFRTDSYRSDVV